MIVTSPIENLHTLTRAQLAAIARGWWVLLLTGVLGILAGAIIAFGPWTEGGLVVFIGTLLIVRGALTLFSVPVDGSLRTWSIMLGAIEIAVGIGVFLWPGPALLVVALSIGWLLLFRGNLAIVGSIFSRKLLPYWGLVLVAGILEVVVALFLLTRPDITLLAAVLAIGFAAMLYGALEVVAAFEVRNLPRTFDDLTAGTGTAPADTPLAGSSAPA